MSSKPDELMQLNLSAADIERLTDLSHELKRIKHEMAIGQLADGDAAIIILAEYGRASSTISHIAHQVRHISKGLEA